MAKQCFACSVHKIKPSSSKKLPKDVHLLPCAHIRKTRGLKIAKPCTPDFPTGIRLRKGVLGVIKNPVVSADGTVQIHPIKSSTATKIVCGIKKLEGDLVLINPSNKVCPASLPDLSDLALMPKGLKYYVKWFISTHGGKEGFGYEHVIPKAVMQFADPPSDIPSDVEHCYLSDGEHCLNIPSYRNDFKLFSVTYPLFVSKVMLNCTTNTSNVLDGRNVDMKIMVKANNNLGIWSGSCIKGLRYMVWNCRDMGRDTFLPLIKSAIELHMPHVVLLTETRVSIHMARLICGPLKPYAVYGNSRNDYEGGFAIISFSKHFSMSLLSSYPQEYSWAFDKLL